MTITDTKAFELMLANMRTHNGSRRALEIPEAHKADERVAKFSLAYLEAFGYFARPLADWSNIKPFDIVVALDLFQHMFGVSQTGTLSVPTVRAMETPRCGCPDIVRNHHETYKRVRSAAAANMSRWQKDGITYRITHYLPGLDTVEVDKQIQLAFDSWARLGNISIAPAPAGADHPDILIGYGTGPQSNFDGPGGTLAWAYTPTGEDKQLLMRFDLDETWALSVKQRGVLLFNVACHEFGHLLGLDHSRVPSALMAPYYNATIGTPQPDDDISRFQSRYGVRVAPPAPLRQSLVVEIEGEFTSARINGKEML